VLLACQVDKRGCAAVSGSQLAKIDLVVISRDASGHGCNFIVIPGTLASACCLESVQ